MRIRWEGGLLLRPKYLTQPPALTPLEDSAFQHFLMFKKGGLIVRSLRDKSQVEEVGITLVMMGR